MNRSEEYYKKGWDYFEQEKMDLALDSFTKGISENSNDSKLYLSRAQIWNKLGNYDKALSDLSEAIYCNPKNAEAYWHRALIYQVLGDKEQSRLHFQKALQMGYKG